MVTEQEFVKALDTAITALTRESTRHMETGEYVLALDEMSRAILTMQAKQFTIQKMIP